MNHFLSGFRIDIPIEDASYFERVVSVHCLAALGLAADVEQPFDCLIIQNRQDTQSMGRSMDWTLEDNMVGGLFFCATQAVEGVIPYLFKQERKSPTPVRRRLSRIQVVLGRATLGVFVPMSGMRVRSLAGLSNHSAFHQ